MNISPYDTKVGADDFEAPLTNAACRYVPQTGVHLYHLSESYYSQIARLVLEEKGASWTSHPVLILAYEQYSPAYVRINPRCVVPTLVMDGKVTTDAYNICRVVNERFGGPSLIPDDPQEKACMETFSQLQKSIFVEALSYGDVPDFTRPWYLRLFSGKNHANKAPILRRLIQKHGDDAFLKEAYEKKLAILEFTENTLHSPEQMHEIMETIYRSMDRLETQLAEGPFSNGGWLCARHFTQADLEWSAMLRRFHMIRLEPKLMATRPHCAQYQAKLFARPPFIRGMIDWEHPVKQILLPLVWKKITGRLGSF